MVLKLSELEKFYAEYNYINGEFNLLDEIDIILSSLIDEKTKTYRYFRTGILLLFYEKWRKCSKVDFYNEIARINEVRGAFDVSNIMCRQTTYLFGTTKIFKPTEFEMGKYKLKFYTRPDYYFIMYSIHREIISKNYKYFSK
ncbi:hypothetical protein [Clostridium perfringens]|uniref:Uncharacterized protein n=1 Tax=Clostridium perfringens TaxID=1502 RepID=A0A2X3IS05_CLOPF|nr:hypothetical protein [Clostridium perfringens]MBO3392299.1 hypothetical protein [Clostridium perfringens]MBO3399449.1 hypothetical protein [Clostridium perfringens]MBO3408394.1 hypothetical protein [Clostridium perfringens]MBO3424439.1 hypothetical protein [Clostridium perfringens]MDM0719904.1 hypothetical protein [Clostridium perfringens]